MRTKATFRLPPDLMRRLADYAARKRISQAVVVEAALESYLSPDGPERLVAALSRRLDRLSSAGERLERHVTIGSESLALFVRFWLTATPTIADGLQAAAQARGEERYEALIDALGRRMARGKTLAEDIVLDPIARASPTPTETVRSGSGNSDGPITVFPA